MSIFGARIEGQLNCRGARLGDGSGPALTADELIVDGGVYLTSGFTANGAVRLFASQIGGQLNCAGATITRGETGPEHAALVLELASINGHVLLGPEFVSDGAVNMVDIKVRGQVICEGATIGGGDGHAAFVASGADLHDLFLDAEFKGEVSIINARADQVMATEGTFTNRGSRALSLPYANLGSLLLGGVKFTGGVYAFGATIGGLFGLSGTTISNPGDWALNGQRLKVGGELRWRPGEIEGSVDLRGAMVEILDDDVDAWPEGWNGSSMRFRDLGSESDLDVRSRIRWIQRQVGEFRPSLYTQVAAVYSMRGHPQERRRVLVERERARVGSMPRRKRPIYQAWGLLSAYGYRPWRVLLYLASLIAIGSVAFWVGDMTDVQESALQFRSGVYAADVAIPLVDLGLASSWQPTSAWLQGWMWFTEVTGWILSAAFVAAVTGLFRPDE